MYYVVESKSSIMGTSTNFIERVAKHITNKKEAEKIATKLRKENTDKRIIHWVGWEWITRG